MEKLKRFLKTSQTTTSPDESGTAIACSIFLTVRLSSPCHGQAGRNAQINLFLPPVFKDPSPANPLFWSLHRAEPNWLVSVKDRIISGTKKPITITCNRPTLSPIPNVFRSGVGF